MGTVEGLTKPAEQTAPSGGAAAPSAANATGAKAGATAAAGTPLTILSGANVQGNPAFDPNPISVKKGDTITVTNKDTLPHTVTSGKGPSDPTSAKSFDTSIIEAGATADISTASLAPGDFPFYCTVHPYMTGKLTLTAGGGGAAATGSAPSAANATSATPSAANATGAKAGAAAAAGTPLTILSGANVQGNPAFDPNPISVKKGDTITVTNKDTLPHTVTSGTGPSDPNSAKSFDTSIIEAGATADISTASFTSWRLSILLYCSSIYDWEADREIMPI